MRKWITRCALLVAVLAVVIPALGTTGTGQDTGEFWMTDLDAATKLAADEGRPLLITFR